MLKLTRAIYACHMTPSLRLDEEADALLTALAKRLGASKQHALQMVLDQFICENDSHAIAARTVDEILIRDAPLLQRLADA